MEHHKILNSHKNSSLRDWNSASKCIPFKKSPANQEPYWRSASWRMPTSLDLPHGVAMFFLTDMMGPWKGVQYNPDQDLQVLRSTSSMPFECHWAWWFETCLSRKAELHWATTLTYCGLRRTGASEGPAKPLMIVKVSFIWLLASVSLDLGYLGYLGGPHSPKTMATPNSSHPFYVRMFHLNNQRFWDTPRKAEKIWQGRPSEVRQLRIAHLRLEHARCILKVRGLRGPPIWLCSIFLGGEYNEMIWYDMIWYEPLPKPPYSFLVSGFQ